MAEREAPAPAPAPGGAWRMAGVIGGWALLVGGLQLYAWQAGISPFELLHELIAAVHSSVAAPLLFIGATMLSPLLLIPAALLGSVAGACFGPVAGVVYTLVGCNLSALLTYSLGRFTGQGGGRVARLCARYGGPLRERPFVSVILLRLSFLPYDPINYLIGMLRVRVGPFVVANTVGSLPGVIAIVLAGSALGDLAGGIAAPSPAVLAGALALVLLSALVALLLRRRARSV